MIPKQQLIDLYEAGHSMAQIARHLETSRERFGKVTIIPPQGRGSYGRRSEYGVATVGCYNVKLRRWIDEQLAQYGRRRSSGAERELGKFEVPGSNPGAGSTDPSRN